MVDRFNDFREGFFGAPEHRILAEAIELYMADRFDKEPEVVWQRDLSIGLDIVADVRLAEGDHAGALSAYDESLVIARKLAASDPGNAGWQRDVSGALAKVASLRLGLGDRTGALSAYEEGLVWQCLSAGADRPRRSAALLPGWY